MVTGKSLRLQARIGRIREQRSRGEQRRAEAERQTGALQREFDLSFPNDLERLAGYLDIREVRRRPIGIDGRIILDGLGQAIEIDDRLSEEAARFVLAHELAHLALARTTWRRTSQAGTLAGADYRSLEEDCDAIAGEMLAPRGLLAARFATSEPSLSDASLFASDEGLDFVFLVSRLVELGVWNARLVVWAFNAEGRCFDPIWTVPATTGYEGAWRLVPLGVEVADVVSGGVCSFSGEVEFAPDEVSTFRIQSRWIDAREMLTILPRAEVNRSATPVRNRRSVARRR